MEAWRPQEKGFPTTLSWMFDKLRDREQMCVLGLGAVPAGTAALLTLALGLLFVDSAQLPFPLPLPGQ